MISRNMQRLDKEETRMIKLIMKILVLPIVLVLAILGFVLNTGIKLYCLASAIAFKILALCALIAVCTSQWQPLMIIGIMVAVVLFIAYAASFIMAQIAICRDSLCGYFRA